MALWLDDQEEPTRPQPSAEPVAVWREAWDAGSDAAQMFRPEQRQERADARKQAAAAVIASALEAARREALEQAAKVADYAQQDWQQQPTRSDNPPGKMLEETFAKGCSETARIIAKAIRALKENPNAG